MTRRRLLAVAAGFVAVGTAAVGSLSAAASTQPQPSAGRLSTAAGAESGGSIVVIGTGGLSWGDISAQRTPAVWSLLRDGATATMTAGSPFPPVSRQPIPTALVVTSGGPEQESANPPAKRCPSQ